MRKYLTFCFLAPLAVACATPEKRTAIGAGGGAAVGAGVGALAGGWKGALVGAGAGALAGGAIGNYLDKQAQELEKVAETKRTRDGILVKLKSDLLFDSGSSALRPQAIEDLVKVGDILAKYSDDRVRIEGHTDSSGSARYNEDLSRRRADAVKSVLLSRGVKEQQMLVLGMGEARPVADNGTATGRAHNRRVELHIDVPTVGDAKNDG